MPSVFLTFLLHVPPHQRQLAYNSTASGRSQHILAGFVEVGHLAVFAVIVRIVPIICTIRFSWLVVKIWSIESITGYLSFRLTIARQEK